jgi:hypothetical protein
LALVAALLSLLPSAGIGWAAPPRVCESGTQAVSINRLAPNMADIFLDFDKRFMLPSIGIEFHSSSRPSEGKVTGGRLRRCESKKQEAGGKTGNANNQQLTTSD